MILLIEIRGNVKYDENWTCASNLYYIIHYDLCEKPGRILPMRYTTAIVCVTMECLSEAEAISPCRRKTVLPKRTITRVELNRDVVQSSNFAYNRTHTLMLHSSDQVSTNSQ